MCVTATAARALHHQLSIAHAQAVAATLLHLLSISSGPTQQLALQIRPAGTRPGPSRHCCTRLPYLTSADPGPLHQDRQPVCGNCSSSSPLWSLVTAVGLPCQYNTTASPAAAHSNCTQSPAQAAPSCCTVLSDRHLPCASISSRLSSLAWLLLKLQAVLVGVMESRVRD